MSKVRINDLARELEVKSRAILDALTHVGVTEKKTHSSSLEEDEAERVRLHFQRSGKNGAGAARVDTSEPKQKIDWSRVSKPGDVLKAIQQRKDEAAAMAQRPTVPTPVPPQAVKPPISVHPVAPASPVASAGPSPAVGVPPSSGHSGFLPRTGPSEPGWARSTYFSSTPTGATADRSPAPAGAEDRSRPAPCHARNCRQATCWAGRCQAAGCRRGSKATDSRCSQARSPERRSAPACSGSPARSAPAPGSTAAGDSGSESS
jgi:translation initiation factor IF-2